MNTTNNSSSEAEIRNLIEARVAAVRRKDAGPVVAPDAAIFDVINPLRSAGADAVLERAREWFASFDGPIGYELRDLRIEAGEDIGFCHSLNQVRGTKTDGGAIEMWWRATACFRKVDGKWIVVHEHSSVPFDMNTGQTSLGLEP